MPQSYGGYVWSSQEPVPYNSDTSSIGALALFGAGAAGAFWASTREGAGGRRPIDYIAASARYGGNQSPFQLFNTFRAPEFLSPFTSDAYRRMGRDTYGEGAGFGFAPDGSYRWSQDFLSEDSTYDWLKHVSNLDETALREAGITRGMIGSDGQMANELVWERTGRFGGRLSTQIGSERRVIADSVSLMAANQELNTAFSGKHGINRAVASVFAAADIYGKTGADADKFDRTIFARAGRAGQKSQTASFIPVNAPSLKHWGGTDLLRAVPAFSMDRFSRLLSDLSYQFGGETGASAFKNLTGTTAGILPGPASAQFMRFGGRAAAVGAGIMAVGEADWARRQFGLPGQVLASAAVSAGVAQATYKLTRTNPRYAFAAGVGSFFGQMVMPGFDQGVKEGMLTTFANLNMVRAAPVNPFNYLRRTVEGVAPGFSSWQTGALLGIGAAAATALRVPGGKRIPTYLAERFNFGFEPGDVALSTDSIRDWYKNYTHDLPALGDAPDKLEGLNLRNARWYEAEQARADFLKSGNPITEQLLSELDSISGRYGDDFLSRVRMNVRGHATTAFHSFFGADISKSSEAVEAVQDMGFRGLGKFNRALTVGAFALATHQFMTGGTLGSMEDMGTLSDLYEGKKLVEIKKGRFWEGGGTPYEGDKTSFFRPHWYHLMRTDAYDASVWGEDHDRYSPVSKFFLKNFTYHLEREQYYDRPYPISGAAFADIPVIGGLLSSTVGRVIKPPKIMHAQEWIREGQNGLEFASVFRGSRQEPAYSLGAEGPGIPQSPFGAKEQLSFLSYQFRELEGLTGYAKNVMQELITGSQQFNTDSPMLATANEMSSWRQAFWERDLGGMLGTNEFLRRFLPKTPYEKRRQNPIANTMPSWLPDKFHYGDPYSSIKTGWSRLPGPGYAALHPELTNLDPDDYPLLYQYSILSDVAPYSREYSVKKEMVYRQRAQGMFDDRQQEYIDYLDQLHARKMNQLNFDSVHPNAVDAPGFSLLRDVYAGGSQALRTVAAPAEYMVPMGFRPVQKFLNDRDPIEEYEYQRLYGTPMSFWDKPWRDWFRPAMYSSLNMLGFEGKPLWRHEADVQQSHFDKLNYLRFMRAAEQHRAAGDGAAAQSAEWRAGQTRTGVNPMGTPLAIYWSLPAEERKFFNAFAHAQGPDRSRILEMVPEDQTHLYKAMWSRMDAGDPSLWAGAPSRIDEQYLRSQMAATQQYFDGAPLPEEDWIGWHCLPVGQVVLDSLTTRTNVDSIVPGHPVWQTNDQNIVLEKHMRYTEEELTTVWVERDQLDSMSATSNHKVLAWRCPWKKDHLRRRIKTDKWDVDKKFEPEWIRIGELQKGDYLVVPASGIKSKEPQGLDMAYICQNVPKVKFNNSQVWRYYKASSGRAATVRRWISLSTDVAWLVGYYMAEGHVGKRNGVSRYVEWTSHVAEDDLRCRAIQILRDEFYVKGVESIRIRQSGSSGSVRAQGLVAHLLGEYFAPGVAHTKKLCHADKLLWSQDHVEAFLGGLYAGDGTKQASSSTLSTTSEELHTQVKEMLLACGIVPSVRRLDRENRKASYQIRFVRSNESAKRIHDMIVRDRVDTRDVSPAKPKAFTKGQCVYSRIGKIEKTTYAGYVFDFTVENVHAYRSPIGLYHNSDVDMDDIRVRYVHELGKDIHDYGLWESQLRQSYRQPFLEGSTQYLHDTGGLGMFRSMTHQIMGPGSSSTIVPWGGQQTSVNVTYNDSREHELMSTVFGRINGY